jgi:xanthine dehydrogenase accessory factor
MAKIGGIVRGLIREGVEVKKGMKVGDIDPRGKREFCFTISDKARAIGGGVLEAILYWFNK